LTPFGSPYDHDGNPLTDALWSYTWDAENRLIAMESTSAAIAGSITKQKLEFAYDYLHRRVQKKTYTWSGSAWTLATHRKFLYEGWNVIREDELLTAKVKTLAWGLDLVGSLSQSGGVGALLALHDTATNEAYLPGYDGNGNVAVMVDVATGTLKATYEYSPFGQFLRKEGSYAEANPIRFSTKYTDEETDLVYYGRRYYDPMDGRFVGRDPIEEQGGINMYAFVANNTVNSWDYLGMHSFAWGSNWSEGISEEQWADFDEDRRYDPTDFMSGLGSFGEQDPWVVRELNLFNSNNFNVRTHDNRDLSGSGSGGDLISAIGGTVSSIGNAARNVFVTHIAEDGSLMTSRGEVTNVNVLVTPHNVSVSDMEGDLESVALGARGLDLIVETVVGFVAGRVGGSVTGQKAKQVTDGAIGFEELFTAVTIGGNALNRISRGTDIHASVEFETPGSRLFGFIPVPWGTETETIDRRVDHPNPHMDGGWPYQQNWQIEQNIDEWWPYFLDTAVDIIIDEE